MNKVYFLPGFILFVFAALIVLGLGFLFIRWIIGTPGRRKAALFFLLFVVIGTVPAALLLLRMDLGPARVPGRNTYHQAAEQPAPIPTEGHTIHQSAKQDMLDLVTLTDETVNAWKQPPEKGSFPPWVKQPELFDPPAVVITTPIMFKTITAPNTYRIAGYSDFAPEQDKAVASAWQCAKNRITAVLMFQIWPQLSDNMSLPKNRQFLQAEIEKRRHELVKNRFIDTVTVGKKTGQGPVGTVYRAAVLVELPPEKQSEILSKRSTPDFARSGHYPPETGTSTHTMRRLKGLSGSWRSWLTIVVTGWLFLIILLSLFFFLESFTRKHFGWALRMLGVLLYCTATGVLWLFFHVSGMY